ncbi:MAG: cobaltochelatase subunit CobN [Thermoanaerobacteraceae bacterium]|nr:cobaltochelatase subunit CobN [Thermoanaerobacteraceae bacterium]
MVQATSAWEDQKDLVDTYMNRMSYIDGKTVYGLPSKEVFQEILKSVDIALRKLYPICQGCPKLYAVTPEK